MGRERRAGEAAAAGRPSDVSRDRLARRVRAEVADVRVRLEEAVLRSDALYATGQPERAAAVLDEQHALLAELQDTIASAVAAASVEAEAEAVIFGSPAGVPVLARDEAGLDVPPVPAPRRVRATASAVASAVAVLALLILGAPTPSPSTMAAADADDVADDLVADGAGEAVDGTDGTRVAGASPERTDERAIGPNEREVRRLFGSPAPSPDGDVGVGLSELQALVDQFVATVVRAAGGLATIDPVGVTGDVDTRPSQPSGGDEAPELRREADGTAATSRPAEEDAGEDAGDRDAADDDPDDRADGDDAPDDDPSEEPPGLPVTSEDGNAANPGVPPVLE